MKKRRKKRIVNKKPQLNSKNRTDNCGENIHDENSSSQNTSKLCCFSSTDYIILASTVAIALGEELSETDLSILSTFFAVLSDELALITSVKGCTTDNTPVFVPPVPDVAMTSSKNEITHSKKNVKKKRKKK